MNKTIIQLIVILTSIALFSCNEQSSLDRLYFTINTEEEFAELTTKRYHVKFLTIGSSYSDSINAILDNLNEGSLTGLTVIGDSVIIHRSKKFVNLKYLHFFAQYVSMDKNFICADSLLDLTVSADSIGRMDFISGITIKNLAISTERKQIEEWIYKAENIEYLWVDSSVYKLYEKNLPINTNLGFIK